LFDNTPRAAALLGH